MARPFKQRCICSVPKVTSFVPEGQPAEGTVRIGYDEYEVLRLMDFRKMTQAECAERARQAVVEALVLGRRLKIEGGDVLVCPRMKPECIDEPFCCHRRNEKDGGMAE